MILSDIRTYVKERGRVTLDDIAARFEMDKSAAAAIMEQLISRGLVTRPDCTSCQSSGSCSLQSQASVYYAKEQKS